MQRIWKALTWEYFSHAVHLAYAAVLVAIIVPWLGWALTGFVEMSADGAVHISYSFYFSYVGIALFFFGAAAGAPIAEMPKFRDCIRFRQRCWRRFSGWCLRA
ncbi:MAG: hypothetical protein P8J37_18990 [Fuerstiella sp.]|nr:hypothetical protein [Fuerstiella sp.]